MEINGIAHTFLTSGDFPAAKAFYGRLLPLLGLTPVLDTDDTYYCVGGRTALGIRAGQIAQLVGPIGCGRVDDLGHQRCRRRTRAEDLLKCSKSLLNNRLVLGNAFVILEVERTAAEVRGNSPWFYQLDFNSNLTQFILKGF